MASTRDPWLDNAKMLLITAVVVGHVLAILPGDDAFRDHLYDAIYVVHMPAFVLISGYLSQRFSYSRRHLRSLLTTLVVPYVVFTLVLHGLYTAHVGANTDRPMLLDPFWAMWFLAALFLWRLASPVLRLSAAAVPLSILVALVVPMHAQVPELALNRALQFLPFFVIGLHLRKELLEQLQRPVARVLGVLVLAAVWVGTTGFSAELGSRWLYHNHSFGALGVDTAEGITTRGVVLVASLAGALALLALTPTRHGWWTAVGTQSMTVYLGHTVVVKALQYDGFFRGTEPRTALWQGIAIALLIVAVLASPPVVRSLRWLTDPVGAVTDVRARRRARADAPSGAEGARVGSPGGRVPTSARERSAEAGRAREPQRA